MFLLGKVVGGFWSICRGEGSRPGSGGDRDNQWQRNVGSRQRDKGRPGCRPAAPAGGVRLGSFVQGKGLAGMRFLLGVEGDLDH